MHEADSPPTYASSLSKGGRFATRYIEGLQLYGELIKDTTNSFAMPEYIMWLALNTKTAYNAMNEFGWPEECEHYDAKNSDWKLVLEVVRKIHVSIENQEGPAARKQSS